MKNIYFIFLLFVVTKSNAQCTTTANSFGNNTSITMYNVTGTVQVKLENATSVSIILGSNFATAAGPDVKVFLVNKGNLTNAQLKIPAMFLTTDRFEVGTITNNVGVLPKTFTVNIPAGKNITNFDTVYFFCQQFSQFWDFGSFTKFTANNCASVLSTEDFINNNAVSVYPNPSENNLTINIDNENLELINIYNVTGKLLFSEKNKNNIDVSNLAKGLYFIDIFTENNKYSEKFLKN